MNASPSSGTLFADRFVIERHVSQGGMAAVYRARDTKTDRIVALKLLDSSMERAVHRFAREAALLAGLRHPGIVSYVAHGVAEGDQPYLAMEWLEGEDLAQRLSRQALRREESNALLRGAAAALAVVHARGIVHRDLKPGNLF